MTGVNVAQYNVAAGTFAYSSLTDTATWTLPNPIGADKLLLELNADGSNPIEDSPGTPLDGEWTNPTSTSSTGSSVYPSGNATAGGNFSVPLQRAAGRRESGRLRPIARCTAGARRLGSAAGQGNYTIFKDVDGSGEVQSADGLLVLGQLETSLPSGQPAAASFPAIAKPAASPGVAGRRR